jgi:multiple sugar transport system substrate-binding protein
LGAAGAMAGVTALSACGGAPAQETKQALSSAPVTISYFKRGTLNETQMEALLKDWNVQHPTWKVEMVQGVNDEKLAAGLAAGEKQDVLTYNYAARTMVIAYNMLRPIDSYVAKDKYNVKKFSEKEVDLVGRYDGKLWALPYAYGGNATALFYNRNMFKEAGVQEPPADWNQAWTFDQFRENARKLTKRSGSTLTQVAINGLSDASNNTLTSLGVLSDAKVISDDYKKSLIDQPATVEAFQRYADLIQKDQVTANSPGADLGSGNAFLNGKQAMHVICCGPLGFVRQIKPTGIDWGFAPMPKMKYSSPDFQSVLTLMPNSGANPDHGWELFKYLIEDARLGTQEERVPAVLEDAPDWAKAAFAEYPNARAQVLIDGIKIARPVDKIKYHPGTTELYATAKPFIDNLFAGKETAKQAFTTLQPQLQAVVDKYPAGK